MNMLILSLFSQNQGDKMMSYLSSPSYTYNVKKCCLSLYTYFEHVLAIIYTKNKGQHDILHRSQSNERGVKYEYKYRYKNDM